MKLTVIAQCWVCAACCFATSAYASAKGASVGRVATLTILEGPLQVVRGAAKLSGVRGAVLQAEDILETQAGTAFARLEMDDGLVLDVGPSTRILLGPLRGAPWRAYVLQGWTKLSVGQPYAVTNTVLVAMPMMDLTEIGNEAVLRVDSQSAELLTPSGPAVAEVKAKDGRAASTKLDRGAHLTRYADGSIKLSRMPPAAFLQAMPRPFMDTLPSQLAAVKGKDVRLAPSEKLIYADVERWLNAEPRVRVRFLARWRLLLRDDAFRKRLIEQMSLHPEWYSILHPHVSESGRTPLTPPTPAPIEP